MSSGVADFFFFFNLQVQPDSMRKGWTEMAGLAQFLVNPGKTNAGRVQACQDLHGLGVQVSILLAPPRPPRPGSLDLITLGDLHRFTYSEQSRLPYTTTCSTLYL